MSASGNEIGDLLVDIGIITAEELASAMEEQASTGERLTLILDRLGLVTYHQLKDSLELQFGVNFYSLAKNPPEREVADLVSLETKTKFKLIPVANTGTQFTIAMVNPDDLIAVDTLRVELRSGHIKQMVCTADEFEFCLKSLYEPTENSPEVPAEVLAEVLLEEPVVEPVTTIGFKQAEALSEEFTLPASVIAQANALEKKATAKVPAKKHLQSLFGDDDDDDDMNMPATTAAPAPAMVEAVEPVVEKTVLVEAIPDPIAEPIADPIIEQIAEAVVEPVLEPIQALEEPAPIVEEEAPPVAPPQIETAPVVTAVASSEVVSPPSVLDRVLDQVIGTIASTAGTADASADASADAKPLPVNDPLPISADLAAVKALEQVAQAESAMQAAVANVTNHLVESSLGALNANANRQLLEDVVESELGGSEEETDIHRMKEAQNASVMLLAHEIIGKATQKRCSDIHLEPDASGVSLRYFLHGELLADCMLPLEIHGALVGSYKVIAGLNPQELVKPQDKKFTTRVEEDEVELRITTIPTDNGEMVAISMRFTDPNSAGAIAQAKLASMSED